MVRGRGVDSIAVIAHGHPSLTKGGGEIAAYNLFLGLKQLGCRVVFITVCPQSFRASLALDGDDESVVFFDQNDYSFFYNIVGSRVRREVIAKLAAVECTIASLHHYYYIGIDTIREINGSGMRTFLTLHEYLAICHHYGQMVTRPSFHLCTRAHPSKCHRCYPELSPQQFEQRRAWLLHCFGGIEGFISPSQFLKDRYGAWGLDAQRIAVIENGLRVGPRAPHPPPGEARARRSEWVFGYFGQINPFKGAEVLLDCAALLKKRGDAPTCSIRVHGDLGGMSEDLQVRFRTACLAGAIDYRGPYDNADVVSLMSECDYILVPSRWWENSPLVIQEAFTAGRPVIASGIGGLAEKVRNGETGFHFRPGSAADLADVILAAANAETANRLRANLVPAADNIKMANDYLDLFSASTR